MQRHDRDRRPRSAVVEAHISLALASLSAGLIHVMPGFHLVWSRTIGLPFGPEPGEAEAIGIPDAVCTFTELVLVAACSRSCSARASVRSSAGRPLRS